MKTISQLPKKKQIECKEGELHCSLRALREKYGLTLREVAEHSGVSHPTLDRMEIGSECNLSNAIKVADFFETTIEKIWNLRGDPHGKAE